MMLDFAEKKREFDRSLRDCRDAEAALLAVELAPYFDEIAEENDKNPKAIVPQWGLLA